MDNRLHSVSCISLVLAVMGTLLARIPDLAAMAVTSSDTATLVLADQLGEDALEHFSLGGTVAASVVLVLGALAIWRDSQARQPVDRAVGWDHARAPPGAARR
jgi:hypothetical protein